jgi:hypothetical protein
MRIGYFLSSEQYPPHAADTALSSRMRENALLATDDEGRDRE